MSRHSLAIDGYILTMMLRIWRTPDDASGPYARPVPASAFANMP